MKTRLLYNDVFEYVKQNDYKLLNQIYKRSNDYLNMICPNGHFCKIRYNNFYKGHRCGLCSNRYKFNFNSIKKIIENEGYILLDTEYINSKTPLNLICNNGHEYKQTFAQFNIGRRCRDCFFKKNKADGNKRWKSDRTRNRRTKILSFCLSNINILKDDPNYTEYLKNPENFNIDHIFPRVAFIDYNIDKKFGLNICKELCNNIENLRIIPKEENLKKSCKYNHLDFLLYIQRYEIQQKL